MSINLIVKIFYIFCSLFSQKLQKFLDDITPFRTARWIAALVIVLLFMLRIIMLQVILNLHLFINFLWFLKFFSFV